MGTASEAAGDHSGSLVYRVAAAATLLAVLGTLLVVASLVPVQPLALLEHFRLQLLCGSAVVTAAAALLRLGGWADVAAFNTLLALVLVAPGLGGERNPGPADGVRVRVLLSNVLTSNRDVSRLARLIADTRPDVIALVEPNRTWFAQLAPTLKDFPGRVEIHDEANFGIALYARGQVRGGGELLGSAQTTIVATVVLADSQAAPLTFVITHPIPPVSTHAAQIHARHLAAVARRVAARAAQGEPVILAGDFNTTPWSRSFATLVQATGLVDTRRGLGAQPTFPAFPWWTALVRIPIDHVLVSPSIGVIERRVERPIGSDHLPVFVELVVPRR